MESRGFNPYMPSVKNVIDFLHWKFSTSSMRPTSLNIWQTAIKFSINTAFHPIVDNILVTRFITGLFHMYPTPPAPPKKIWDVNVVLDYWDRQPPNCDLPLVLSQKTVLLMLISTMRRRCDILSMHHDNIIYKPNCMLFPLESYPKTYTLKI